MTALPDSRDPAEATDPIRLLAGAIDGGASGTLDWPSLGDAGPLILREGRLYLRKESALGLRGEAPVERGPGADTLAGLENPAEARLLGVLARFLSRPRGAGAFREGAGTGERLVGPLHARPLVMEGAVAGRSEADLLELLRGPTARWQAVPTSPALQKLSTYPEPLRRLVSRMAEPATIDELLRLAQTPRLVTLANLGRLRAIGLIRLIPAAPRSRPEEDGEPSRIDPEVLSRFLQRIGASLRGSPLELETAEHRSRVAALVREGGGESHYDLLQVDEAASNEEVAVAYERIARVVHPANAETLELTEGEGVLHALFERVTHAYRTLSDPERRREYDLAVGTGSSLSRDLSTEEMVRVRQRMAKANYRRAKENLDQEDFHYAVELMRDAVRWDERAEYWALLGEAQLQNPKWADQAAESLKKALELEPGEIRYRVLLGRAFETAERQEEASEQYAWVLERFPDLPEAREGLERIESFRAARRPPGLLDRITRWLGRDG